eukprot:228854_1
MSLPTVITDDPNKFQVIPNRWKVRFTKEDDKGKTDRKTLEKHLNRAIWKLTESETDPSQFDISNYLSWKSGRHSIISIGRHLVGGKYLQYENKDGGKYSLTDRDIPRCKWKLQEKNGFKLLTPTSYTTN